MTTDLKINLWLLNSPFCGINLCAVDCMAELRTVIRWKDDKGHPGREPRLCARICLALGATEPHSDSRLHKSSRKNCRNCRTKFKKVFVAKSKYFFLFLNIFTIFFLRFPTNSFFALFFETFWILFFVEHHSLSKSQ